MRCLLLALAGAGCTGAPPQRRPALNVPMEAKAVLGDEWFAARAQTLGLTVEAAKARDGAITRDGPPADRFWDDQLALQSASLWRLVCNECHQGRRGISSALAIPAPPPGWGEGQGWFFGRSRSYAETYDVIAHGLSQPGGATTMPAFENRLAREQIWGLIRFLEHASHETHRSRPSTSETSAASFSARDAGPGRTCPSGRVQTSSISALDGKECSSGTVPTSRSATPR